MGGKETTTGAISDIQLDKFLTKKLLKFKGKLFAEMDRLLHGPLHHQNKQWLKSAEAREILNVSPGTLQTLCISRILPFTKLGGSMYYKASDVDRILERGKIKCKFTDTVLYDLLRP